MMIPEHNINNLYRNETKAHIRVAEFSGFIEEAATRYNSSDSLEAVGSKIVGTSRAKYDHVRVDSKLNKKNHKNEFSRGRRIDLIAQ